MSFNQLGLSAELLAVVGAQGYTTSTPIQQQAIPHVIAGHDLMACAQTGTGKTAAFVLPILHRLTLRHDQPGHIPRDGVSPRVLVLVPTRELAAQVEQSVRTYGRNSRVRSLAVFGGVGINPQINTLRRGVDVLVATPGRLMDHMQQRTVNLGRIEVLILDEADRMLDMGFIRDIQKIVSAIPAKRQSLMFSATFSDEIRLLARDFLTDPKVVEVARRNSAAENVSHLVLPVERDRKKELLLHLFENRSLNQVLIFTRTKHGADALQRNLEKAGIRSAALHGNKTQSARTRALADFKSGKLAALVATDLASRGIDIDELPCVINYELPHVPEDYVHRIGRTGRAGSSGEAISLVCSDERIQLRDIEILMKRELERRDIPGFETVLATTGGSRPQGRPQNRAQARPGGGQGRIGSGGYARAGAPARSGGAAPRRDGEWNGARTPAAGATRSSAAPTRSDNNGRSVPNPLRSAEGAPRRGGPVRDARGGGARSPLGGARPPGRRFA